MKKIVIAAAIVVTLLGALRLAGDAGFWRRYAAALKGSGVEAAAASSQPRLRVAGEVSEPPRATAEAELIAPEALVALAEESRRLGLRAVLVHRHGHRVFEHFAAGTDGTAEIAGGELAAVPFALAVGVLVDARRVAPEAAVVAIRDAARPEVSWRNPWSEAAGHRFNLRPAPQLLRQDGEAAVAETLSQRVWLPLRAADAWLWGSGDASLRVDCCMVARLDDWMRVGDVLLGQGSYQGERIVSPDWVRHLLAADRDDVRHPVWLGAQAPWQGDEPPAARDAFWFDLGADARLWLAPRRGLAVLVWADEGRSRDTLVPNIILRGLLDQAPGVDGATGLNDLVPGH